MRNLLFRLAAPTDLCRAGFRQQDVSSVLKELQLLRINENMMKYARGRRDEATCDLDIGNRW